MLDTLDIELLRQLIEDSRQSYIQLSKKLKAHKDTIRKRVKNLFEKKIIERYTITLNHEKLIEMYPSLWRVVFTVIVLRDATSLVKELVQHKNVIEVDETTPAAIHDIIIHAEFKNMNELDEFTKWLKLKENINSSQLVVMPIFKQHRRRQRIASVLKPDKGSLN